MSEDKQTAIVGVLNRLLEAELAGVVRYTHYSFLVFGFGRIPIVSWLRAQAEESLLHAQQIGEWITTIGAYPSLAIGALLDSHVHDIGTMLRESLDSERQALALYRELLVLAEGQSVALEEFARQMIQAEELHVGLCTAAGGHRLGFGRERIAGVRFDSGRVEELARNAV